MLMLVLVTIDFVSAASFRVIEKPSAFKMRKSVSDMSDMMCDLCDAVVHLNADFRVTKPARHLATLLHKQATNGVMVGDDFLSHVNAEDREVF